jgi:hypothetical protein
MKEMYKRKHHISTFKKTNVVNKKRYLAWEAYEKSNGDTFYYRDPGVKFFYESKSIKQEFVT